MDTITLYSLIILLIVTVLIIGLIIYFSNKKHAHSHREDSSVPVFFPLSGYRSHINGNLMDSGLQGRYWSSTETSPIYARVLSLDRGKTAYITHYLKKHGFPIRSILE